MVWSVLVGMLVLFGVWLPGAKAQEAKEKPVVEEILELLKKQGTTTEAQYQELSKRAKKEEEKRFLAGIEKWRPFLRSADGNFELTLGGRVQSDFHATEGDARTLAGADLNDRFLIRRARLEAGGKLFKWIDFFIQGEFTEGISLKYAYLDFGFLPELRLRTGQFKEPFSLEELTSSRFIDFVERSLVNELAPAIDVGVMVYGSLFKGVVSYSLGGFNGVAEDVADTNDEKDLAARIVLAPFKPSKDPWLKGLQFAGNVTWGDQDSALSAQGRTNARTTNRFRFFAPHNVRGTRVRWGGDLAWLVGPASLKFEYDVQTNDRDGLGPGGRDLDEITARGWYVSATYLLTGEERTLTFITPKRNFDLKGGLGAIELGVRWASLDFDSDEAIDFFAGGTPAVATVRENGADSLTIGVNWYLNRNVRLMFNWTNYWYDNDRGTPFSCSRPTCTAFTQLQPADDTSWEILTRMQVWF